MKPSRLFVISLLLVTTSQASAQAYKCLGTSGKIEYRDRPCTSSQSVEKTFNQAIAPNDTDRMNAIDRNGRQAKENLQLAGAQEQVAGPAVQQRDQEEASRKPGANPGSPAAAPHPAVVSGGICSESYSWDSCRKLGIDSVVDCKRMDEDIVFRTNVLQSKGIQCKDSHRR
jgi:hypothetical protein